MATGVCVFGGGWMSDVFMCGCVHACIHTCIHIVVVNVYVYKPVVDSLEPSRPSFFSLAGRKKGWVHG